MFAAPDPLRAALSPAGALVPLEAVRSATRLPGRRVLLRLVNDRLRRAPRRFAAAMTDAGVVVDGDTADIIERYLYVFGTWEPALAAHLRSVLRPGDVFVDIGANVGYFTLLAASAVTGSGHVVAIEPLPANLEKLRRNVEANDLEHVTVVPLVASDRAGWCEMFSGPDSNRGRASTAPVRDGQPAGRVRRIVASSAVPREHWPRVRAIKIDVEGDELRVVMGLRPLLRQLQRGACVVVEVAPDRLADRGSSASELYDTMMDLGFSAAALANDYHPSSYARPPVGTLAPLGAAPTAMTDVVFTKR